MAELRGVFAPIVTPFRPADGEVDLPWLPAYIAYLHGRGCRGIIPCGTNGEAASLSAGERMAVAEAASAAARPLGMPVIVGTGAAALTDAIALTRHAFSTGADAVLVMPPFYFKKPADAGVAEWFRRLFDAAMPPRGRALLYHIPQTTGVPISDALQLRHFREAYPQLAYFAGNDHRVAEGCLAGAAGSITAGANVFPDRAAAAQETAWQGGDVGPAQTRLSAARSVLDLFPLQPATKAALAEIAGLPETAVRPPQVELTPEQRAQLRQALKELA